MQYFQDLFTTNTQREDMEFLSALNGRITRDMNRELTKHFIETKVVEALHQLNLTKASGPDGMAPIFFQKYWHVVEKSVTYDVIQALNEGQFPCSLNHAFITLIPKSKRLEGVTEYRPIALCNVIYKLFSKVLANKVKFW